MLKSLNAPESEIDKKWAAVAKRRLEQFRSEKVKSVSGEEVLERIWNRFEFVEAIDYFEEAEVGLGYDFAVEVYSAIERIAIFPKIWPILEGEIHRCLVRRFPYGVLYSEEKEEIFILAIMHLHRDPEYGNTGYK